MIDRGEHSEHEEPDAEHDRRVRRRQPQARDPAAAEEDRQQVAASHAIRKPTHRQRKQAEGHEGARREADEAGIRQLPLRRDGDHGRRVDQKDEVIERMRDVDEGNGAARKQVRRHPWSPCQFRVQHSAAA